jgi:dipeptidyl aminopeptidase/acylaminoacyl peptidase
MDAGTRHGAWSSPITAAMVADAVTRMSWPALDGGRVWWLEERPDEQGRGVVCSSVDGVDVREHTAADHNVRSLVHEYGGLPYAVCDGVVWYCNFADQRVWRRSPDGAVTPITPPTPRPRSVRYADLCPAPDGTWLAAVRERHDADGVHNDVVAIPADGGGEPVLLADGSDFVACPRVSPDGTTLAWLAWDHPHMPWDATVLSTGRLTGGRLTAVETVAGGAAIFQPAWSPEGILHLVSDADGWWNLYRIVAGRLEQLTHEDAELGLPLWSLGMGTYAFLDSQRIACLVNRDAALRLHVVDTRTGMIEPTPLTPLLCSPTPAAHDGEVALIAAPDRGLPRVRRWRPPARGDQVVSPPRRIGVDEAHLAAADALTITADDGRVVHAVHWPPTHPDAALATGPPPLLVDVHGGPTGQVDRALRPGVQFWTSRGFAVVAPNYGGSTGYGRAYRERLRGRWGIVDIEDCVSVTRWMIAHGLADRERVAIRGGSAGGYTTLAALTKVDVFTAGVSLFGVSDLRLLADETHKFESHYLDGLVGDDPDAWSDRAPAEHVDAITAPLLILQGEEDTVVPPSQAERMVAELDAAGSPYAYVTFPGEQHGFRRAASIRRALDVELSFYAQVWGFEPADAIAPVEVHHLA